MCQPLFGPLSLVSFWPIIPAVVPDRQLNKNRVNLCPFFFKVFNAFLLFTAHLAGPAGHLAFSFSRIGSTFLHPVLGLVKLLELAYTQAGMAEISPYVVKEP